MASEFASAFLLFIAISNMPYGYYIFLRWVIFVIAISQILLRLQTWAREYEPRIAIMILIAVMFNPVFPFYYLKHTWQILDLISGMAFSLAAIEDCLAVIIKDDFALFRIVDTMTVVYTVLVFAGVIILAV